MTIEEILLERFTVARRALFAGTQRNGDVTNEVEQTAQRQDLRRAFDEAKTALESLQSRPLPKARRSDDPAIWTIEFL